MSSSRDHVVICDGRPVGQRLVRVNPRTGLPLPMIAMDAAPRRGARDQKPELTDEQIDSLLKFLQGRVDDDTMRQIEEMLNIDIDGAILPEDQEAGPPEFPGKPRDPQSRRLAQDRALRSIAARKNFEARWPNATRFKTIF